MPTLVQNLRDNKNKKYTTTEVWNFLFLSCLTVRIYHRSGTVKIGQEPDHWCQKRSK